MDMLEDYLRAVSRLLPKEKRDDIIAELRDEILTRVEAKEEELGRTLTPDETEQLLRDFGHPIVVAARYRDDPQYAVGPTLYPFWMFAVRLAILIQIAVSALVFIGRVVGGGDVAQAFGSAIGTGVTGVVTLIGFATIAAWLIERKVVKIDYLDTWRVQDLRFLDFAPGDWGDIRDWFHSGGSAPSWNRQPDSKRWTLRRSAISRGIGAVVGAVFVLLWWTGVISFDLKAIDPARLPFLDFGRLADVDWPALKAMVYWPVIAYLGVVIAFGAAMLAQPRAVRLHGLMDIIVGTAIVAGVSWVWTVSPIASRVGFASPQDLFERVHAMIMQPMPLPVTTVAMLVLVFTALGGGGRILYGLWEALTGLPRRS
jgi:voltage-gated potassium channel Kch